MIRDTPWWALAVMLAGITIASLSCVSLRVEPVFVDKAWSLPSTPASVSWPPGALDEDAARYALEAFPCGMYRKHDGKGRADVDIRISDDDERAIQAFLRGEIASDEIPACDGQSTKHEGAAAYLCTDGHSEIWIDRSVLDGMTPRRQLLVLTHELGHSAGLADDAPKMPLPERGAFDGSAPFSAGWDSIMAANAPDLSTNLDHGRLLPRLSSADMGALEARYCR